MLKAIRLVGFALVFLVMVSNLVFASETFLVEIAGETEIEGASLLTGAIDGSQYYFTNAQIDFPGLEEDNMDLLVWSMDIRFDQEGSGFTVMGSDEKIGTSIRSHTRRDQYHLSAQAGRTVFTPYTVIEPDAWYHVELMGKFSAPDSFMYLLLWRYDEDGQRKNLQIFSNVSRRNLNANVNQGASFIRVEPNTSIDNLRIFHPAVDHLVISAPTDLVVAGQDLQFISEGSRYGIDINVEGIVDYIILDANSEPLNDDQITIDKNGLLQVGEFVPDQSILIKAFDSEGTASDPFALAIKSRLLSKYYQSV